MKRRTLFAALMLVWTTLETATAQTPDEQLAAVMEQLAPLLGMSEVTADELRNNVEEIGGLRFRSRVAIEFMQREELELYIRQLFDAEYPTSFAEREERMLRGFGFLGPDTDLREVRAAVLNENIAGFYDERPGVKKLVAISDGNSLNVINQLILAHELRHALQDQHVVIRDKLAVESDYDDRRIAALSMFEGDALLVMQQYMVAAMSTAFPEMADLVQNQFDGMGDIEIAQMFAGPSLANAPPVVQAQLIAPYTQGLKLAAAIHEKGGFSLLNSSLQRPPRSTEQLLHPEKYLNVVDEPVQVRIRSVRASDIDFEGTLGELMIRSMLQNGPSAPSASVAAEGWGGDSYVVVRSETGYDLRWETVWDSPADAREFEQAFGAYTISRFRDEDLTLERSGREVLFERKSFN